MIRYFALEKQFICQASCVVAREGSDFCKHFLAVRNSSVMGQGIRKSKLDGDGRQESMGLGMENTSACAASIEMLILVYSRIDSRKSRASSARKFRELRLISQVGRVHEVM
jgi:hypothetical protein